MPCYKVTASTVAKLIGVSASINLLDGVAKLLLHSSSLQMISFVGFIGHLSSIWLLHKFKADEAVAPFRKRLIPVVVVTLLSVILDLSSLALDLGGRWFRILRLLSGLQTIVFGYMLWMSYWIHKAASVQNKELLYSLLPRGGSSVVVDPVRADEKDEKTETEMTEASASPPASPLASPPASH